MARSVLLIYPNTTTAPVIPGAIPILAGIARKYGWTPYFFDTYRYQLSDVNKVMGTTAEFKPVSGDDDDRLLPISNLVGDLQACIDKIKPDIIAASCMTIDYEFLRKFWGELSIPESTVKIIGGLHSIICHDKVSEDKIFDLICTGEGEEVFAELLCRIDENKNTDDIVGTLSLNKDDLDYKNNGKRNLLDADSLWATKPDYSVFADEYFSYPFDGKMYRRFMFEVARGCVYSCAYCGNTSLKKAYAGLGKFVRHRPVDSVIAGMKDVISKHKIELFYLMDECFLGHPIKWLQEFSAKYAEHIRVPFIVQTRPETITPEKLDLLDAMGAPFYQMSLGVESGSERILYDVCNRRTPKDRIRNAFALLHERNVRTAAFFLIGFPYETREEIFETIELCREIKPTVSSVSIFQPLPGQDLRELCIKEGYITGNEPQISFTEGSVLKMPQITADEILNLRRTFMLYATLPKEYFSDIEACEKDYERNRDKYDDLVKLRWRLANEQAA